MSIFFIIVSNVCGQSYIGLTEPQILDTMQTSGLLYHQTKQTSKHEYYIVFQNDSCSTMFYFNRANVVYLQKDTKPLNMLKATKKALSRGGCWKDGSNWGYYNSIINKIIDVELIEITTENYFCVFFRVHKD